MCLGGVLVPDNHPACGSLFDPPAGLLNGQLEEDAREGDEDAFAVLRAVDAARQVGRLAQPSKAVEGFVVLRGIDEEHLSDAALARARLLLASFIRSINGTQLARRLT